MRHVFDEVGGASPRHPTNGYSSDCKRSPSDASQQHDEYPIWLKPADDEEDYIERWPVWARLSVIVGSTAFLWWLIFEAISAIYD